MNSKVEKEKKKRNKKWEREVKVILFEVENIVVLGEENV